MSFSDPDGARAVVESLLAQTDPPTEILLADNHPDRLTESASRSWGLPISVVHAGTNLGYARACNLVAGEASGDWLFFLNPDARADPTCVAELLAGADDRSAVVGAQVLMADGRTVNAGDNPVHVTGISWSGRFGEPREYGPARNVASVSGAALLVRKQVFRDLGGFNEALFMYYEDTDFAWRARLSGWRVRYVPRSVVRHDYEFERGDYKRFLLERNRLWTVLSAYDATTLALLGPLLIGTEAMVLARAWREGWLRAKLHGWRVLFRDRARLRRWRRDVQARRIVGDSEVIELFTGSMDTPLAESAIVSRANSTIELYRRMVLWALRHSRTPRR